MHFLTLCAATPYRFHIGGRNSGVECQLPKLDVVGSNPIARSNFPQAQSARPRIVPIERGRIMPPSPSAGEENAFAADFHLHSNASDGCDSPRRVMARAREAGLKAVALTDHDTVAGLGEARAEAERLGLEFIDGVELTSGHEGRLIHILGHFICPEDSRLREQISKYMGDRRGRMDEMLKKLDSLGISIDSADFYRTYGETSIGRGHLSAHMVKKEIVRSTREVFEHFLGEEGPAYVPLEALAPLEAVELVRGAGGTATIAHPLLSDADDLIPALVSGGLSAIEVEHPAQDEDARGRYRALAEKYGLIPLGGSDCHGAVPGPKRMGSVRLPLHLVEALRARRPVAAR